MAREWFSSVRRPFRGQFSTKMFHVRASELIACAALHTGESKLVKSKFSKMLHGYRLVDSSDDPAATFIFENKTVYAVPSQDELEIKTTCPLVKYFAPKGFIFRPVPFMAESPAFNLYLCTELAIRHCQEYQIQRLGLERPRQVVEGSDRDGDAVIHKLCGFNGSVVPSKLSVSSSRSRYSSPNAPEMYVYQVDFGTFVATVHATVVSTRRLREMFSEAERASGACQSAVGST